jgi:uncharacterized membrane protein YsdA (DUF1294 family)
MKYSFIIIMAVLLLASVIIPAYALDKRAENNKKIAEFVLDTIKLPYVLMGAFVKQDHEKVKSELEYKGHQGLKEALRKK